YIGRRTGKWPLNATIQTLNVGQEVGRNLKKSRPGLGAKPGFDFTSGQERVVSTATLDSASGGGGVSATTAARRTCRSPRSSRRCIASTTLGSNLVTFSD